MPEHGARQVLVPWAEPGSGFTALFEAVGIDLLRVASIKAVAEHMGLTWDQVDGVMQRAVRRGLARREAEPARRVGVNETSFQRRREYVTAVSDPKRGIVLFVGDDRKQETLASHWRSLPEAHLRAIEVVAMDMWRPSIAATTECVPDGASKIAFDKFHVASHLGDAVDQVRREEHRELSARSDRRLARTRFDWLRNPGKYDEAKDKGRFAALRDSSLRTARAWALKEAAMEAWEHDGESDVRAMWMWWLGWASRCRLEPMRKVGRMIKSHLEGIVTATVKRATNAGAESINARIPRVKRIACGFRNRERFRNALYFHLGGLKLYPAGVTHTDS